MTLGPLAVRPFHYLPRTTPAPGLSGLTRAAKRGFKPLASKSSPDIKTNHKRRPSAASSHMTTDYLSTPAVLQALLAPLGLKLVHVHEGIYFVENNLFLLMESKDETEILVCFNRECPPDKAALAALTLFDRAEELGIGLGLCGTYDLEGLGEQEMKLHIHPQQTIRSAVDGAQSTH